MNKYILNSQEVNWLIANYSDLGAEECAKKLNYPLRVIKGKVNKLNVRDGYKLKLKRHIRCKISKKSKEVEAARNETNYNNLDINNIVFDEKLIYLLGYIWADGCLCKKDKNYHSGKLSLTIAKEDFENIRGFIPEYIKYTCCDRAYDIIRNPHHKLLTTIFLRNILIQKLTIETGFLTKSGGNQEKLLNMIPENLHHYFWLGYFDGDGCFYNAKTANQFSVTSVYNQDWTSVIKLIKKLGIKKYNIQLGIMKNGRYSKVRIVNRPDLKILIEYLYKDKKNNNIGLDRKYNIALEILNKKDKRFK